VLRPLLAGLALLLRVRFGLHCSLKLTRNRARPSTGRIS
jgi:hypothetical protein